MRSPTVDDVRAGTLGFSPRPDAPRSGSFALRPRRVLHGMQLGRTFSRTSASSGA